MRHELVQRIVSAYERLDAAKIEAASARLAGKAGS